MKKILKTLFKNIRKYRKFQYFRAIFKYTKYYDKLNIKSNVVIIQSYDGKNISGNPYYLLKELYQNKSYCNLKLYVVSDAKNYKKNLRFLKNKGLRKVNLIKINSRKYCRILVQAKYLINNSTFPTYFIKKDNQIYLNTWHGTPLKTMGKDIIDSPNELGNTQRNFLMCDYLLYPNKFMFERMRDSYMLNNMYKGKYILSGYPRNDVFFDKEFSNEIKKKLNIDNKKVVVYMPTWRGNLDNKNNQIQYHFVMNLLYTLDNNLNNDTILYVKLHNYFDSKIDYSSFEHVNPFPSEFETYEFISAADCLITDYSSVFFDFSNTGKKIILYGYDKNEYCRTRGMYLDYEKLPFTFANSVDDLIEEINNIGVFDDYKKFNQKYNCYDCQYSAKYLCDYIFNQVKNKLKVIDGSDFANDNPNILIFAGALKKNGITTALEGLVNHLNKDKTNYMLTFYKSKVEKNKDTINSFNGVNYIPIQGYKNYRYLEAICHFCYYQLNLNTKWINKKLCNIYKREIKRIYPNMKFDCVIHYTGYERQIMHIFNQIDAKKMIYIHNDMQKEKKLKGNFHFNSYKLALNNYDKIVVIRETSKREILSFFPNISSDKVVVAHNLNNICQIRNKAKLDIEFDKHTYCNVSLKKLNEVLNDKKKIKFINIGRFSPEKGQKRLIDAFLDYSKNKDCFLIIIGGYGNLFDEIKTYIQSLQINNVIIIQSLSNPYPVIKKSNLFVLSSYYEGLPMTIMEALILHKPVISTNIPGPSEFLKQGYGYLVDNSTEGILQGLNDYESGKLRNLKIFDAEKFNKDALKEFNNIIKNN